MIPDINSFTEFMMYYSGPAFVSARWAAGNVHEDAKLELVEYEERASNGDSYYSDYPPMVKSRTAWGFAVGFVIWPVICGVVAGKKILEETPSGVWSAVKYVFVKPPPRRIRKERKLAALQAKSEALEKELELDR